MIGSFRRGAESIVRVIPLSMKPSIERRVHDGRNGWPNQLLKLELHWASLHHWRLAHPDGIPAAGSQQSVSR